MKYLPLFHHFKAIYQFPKNITFLVKIVASAPLSHHLNLGALISLRSHIFPLEKKLWIWKIGNVYFSQIITHFIVERSSARPFNASSMLIIIFA